MYLTSVFTVISLLALYFVKYSLNYLSIYLVRNNPIYTTQSAIIGNFTPLYLIFSFIQVRNPFSLDFSPLNLLTNGILTFIIPILLSLFSSKVLFAISVLITFYNCVTMTIYKSISAIFILPTNPKIITVIGIAFNSILLI